MNNHNKYQIALISTYIGKLPEHFCLWLESCERNPAIDFFVFTDQEVPINCPKNVIFYKTDLISLKKRFQSHFDFEISLHSTYKLCDFRPMYGLGFQDILGKYNFWGHCDIDLIWGNIRSYISDIVLDKYDRIGELGHFTIYRNSDEINELFMLPGAVFDYKEVFSNPENYAFDETTGMNLICNENNISSYSNFKIADLSYSNSRMKLSVNDFPHEVFFWENGCCYRSYIQGNKIYTEKFMYIHFSKKKLTNNIKIKNIPSFILKKDEIQLKELGSPNGKYIIENSQYKGEYYEKKERLVFKMNFLTQLLMKKNLKQKIIWIKQRNIIKKYNSIRKNVINNK